MSDKEHTFEYKLDFIYQSIAIYAGTLDLYLLVRSEFLDQQFPVLWDDPFLVLLSAIILISIIALLYNMVMRRRIVIGVDMLRFASATRERVIDRSEVSSVHFARERSSKLRQGRRVVQIRLKLQRRSIRIYPNKFSNARFFVELLREWAGPLASERSGLSRRRRRKAPDMHPQPAPKHQS